MKILNVTQGSPEWLQARLGIPTASNFDHIVTIKGEPSAQRQKYLYQLAGEKLTGKPMESYTNGNMERGKELENEARLAYEIMTGNRVEQVGFCLEDGNRWGCSPDGIIEGYVAESGDGEGDGLLEIKCPTLPIAVEYLDKGVLPIAYYQQVQGQLLVTGCEWCDFISYFPLLPLLIIKVKRDEKFLKILEKELKGFCDGIEELTKRINKEEKGGNK